MGDWYSIGILVGLGASIGVATVAALARTCPRSSSPARSRPRSASRLRQWDEAVGGLAGAACGTLGVGADRDGRAPPRRHARRHRRPARPRRARRRGARVRARPRLPRGARGACCSAHACAAGHPTATPGCASSRAIEARRPRRHRRPDAVDVRSSRHARDQVPRRARHVPARDVDVPVADARLPLLDRDGLRIPTCTTSRTSCGGIAVSSGSSSTDRRSARCARPGIARSLRDTVIDLNAQHLSRRRRDDLRGARGDRPDRGRDQHHLLPRHATAICRRSPASRRSTARSASSSTRSTRATDRRADRRAQPRARLDRRVRRVGRPLARHARRLRLPRLLPARLRLRLARRRARTARTRRSRAATPPSRR